ncbi:MAG: anaerobic ribonucleoside-triphosphate reductase activating protein [Eubacteriales bacterium]
MYYGEIKNCDIANGEGVRVSLFVSGCTHHCKGCFNPQTWNFEYGKPYTDAVENQLLELLSPEYIDGITLLGGEPMEPCNQRVLVKLLQRIRHELPQKTVWCFTGYTLEELLWTDTAEKQSRAVCEVTEQFLSMIDVLIDGEFILEKKNISLRFRGSENQRIIDMPRTRAIGQYVPWSSKNDDVDRIMRMKAKP